MPPDLQVGDHATFWRREKGSLRSYRLWVTVLAFSEDREWARVRLPSGWEPNVWTIRTARLSRADPGEGR